MHLTRSRGVGGQGSELPPLEGESRAEPMVGVRSELITKQHTHVCNALANLLLKRFAEM